MTTKKFIQNTIVAFSIGLLFSAGSVSAWSAIWHTPSSWISNGAIVQADKLGESLQYLYNRLQNKTDTLASISCSSGQTVTWNGSRWACTNRPQCPAPDPPPAPVYRSGTDIYYHFYKI